jgi:ribosomal protein L7/L12
MMGWRGWVRTVLEWLGLGVSAKTPPIAQDDAAETAVFQPQPLPQPGTSSSIAKSTTAFGLRLVTVGPDRESVIHLLQEMSGLSLRQIRTLVDSAPVQVLAQIDAHTGRAIQKRLESLGAVCELVGGRPDLAEPHSVLPDAAPKAAHPDNTFFLFGDYDVVLQAAGPQPSQVIQILRDLLNSRTLAEVERLVANAPQRIVQQVPLKTADTIKIRLEQSGAAVEIIRQKRHN